MVATSEGVSSKEYTPPLTKPASPTGACETGPQKGLYENEVIGAGEF